MRKALVSLAGALGLVALLRALRRRRGGAPAADPVDELRATIAETETHEPEPAEEPPSPDERRRRIHERAQEAIDSMRDVPPQS